MHEQALGLRLCPQGVERAENAEQGETAGAHALGHTAEDHPLALDDQRPADDGHGDVGRLPLLQHRLARRKGLAFAEIGHDPLQLRGNSREERQLPQHAQVAVQFALVGLRPLRRDHAAPPWRP